MPTTLATARDAAGSRLAVPHTSGGPSFTVRSGEGTRFGSPSPSAPIRITVARRSTLVGGQIDYTSTTSTFLCTSVVGDVLSGLTPDGGSSDHDYAANDPIAILVDAAAINDLNALALANEAALATRAPLASPTFDGTVTGDEFVGGGSGLTGITQGQVGGLAASLALKATGARIVLGRTEAATNDQSNGTETSATYQQSFLVPRACFGIRLRFTNFAAAGAIPADSYTIVNCYWDCGSIGGGRQRITFNGQHSVTVLPGGFVVSDPIAAAIPAGATITFYQYVTVTSGGKWPLNFPMQGGNFSGGGTDGSNSVTNGGDGSDVTTTALAAEYHAFGFGPVAIYGRLTDTQAPSVLAVGDSILAGYWDTDLKGAFFRAMMAASPAIPFMRCGMPGQTADGFRSPAVYSPVLAAAMDAGITDFVCEYGVNDVQNGYTLAQIQANLQKIWALGTALGARVWQTTITPKTTSTDGYATTANQTRATGFELGGVCDQLNDWIRTTPSPLSGYFDVRLAAESSPGSGLWKAPGHTTDGIHPTPTGAAAHAVAYTTSRFTFP